jgi:hypothetical protein
MTPVLSYYMFAILLCCVHDLCCCYLKFEKNPRSPMVAKIRNNQHLPCSNHVGL